ncbi:hypothetical protein SCLCIDRAFT_141871 [Scleroderma citrinum Foug A]|uniref:Uncharacterized protein n=1 Tax=Scleroderma citrinum Foug A TaxID=1036808 RepID=A0A0C3D6V5_9AGAM|nr:hypothetical protein SCLCIDRAFT_141871 [Scleroderma citrinum Foug A]
MLSAQFFNSGNDLTSILRTCDAVVSGSTALHYLLPLATTPWTLTDLDIYVPLRFCHQLENLLICHGYCIVKQGKHNDSLYSLSKIYMVMSFINNYKKIDVIVCKTDGAVLPIFQFHCTAVMDFITASSIYCAYPSLTFWGLAMINSAPLYQ